LVSLLFLLVRKIIVDQFAKQFSLASKATKMFTEGVEMRKAFAGMFNFKLAVTIA